MAYRSLYKSDYLTDRERKNIILLDVIRRNGPIAKTDISRITQFNIVTVSNYVEHYIDQKLVVEKGLDISSGGRRPELIAQPLQQFIQAEGPGLRDQSSGLQFGQGQDAIDHVHHFSC